MEEKKKRKLYTDSQLVEALEQISQGMTIYQASKNYNIPESTLRDKRAKRYKNRICGVQPVLTAQEEKQIVDWIHYLGRSGFPVGKQQLLEVISKLVKNLERPNPFKDGVPGKGWFQNFMKRHPTVAKRVAQNLPTSRNQVTEEALRAWFDRVRIYLQNQDLVDIFENPKRVFNCDETAFFLSPKESQVLVKRGSKRVYTRVANDEKECLTVLVNVSANGDVAPPMVLYPYKRMPNNIKFTVPSWWGLGNSESGWMNMETFYEYITNVFYPWILQREITLPVALFLDGHTSHISLPLSTFCKEKGIVLIALLPNATHILQPLDVAVFRSVKGAWRTIVRDFRAQNNYMKLKRTDFALEVEKCFDASLKVESIRNGFRCCGLYPFNPDNIDYTKLLSTKTKSADDTSIEESSSSEIIGDDKQFCKQLEARLSPVTLFAFKDNEGDQWTGDMRYTKLYDFWKKHSVETLLTSETTDLELGESTFNNNFDVQNISEPAILNFVVEHDGTLTRDTQAASSSSLIAHSTSTLVNTTDLGLSDTNSILHKTVIDYKKSSPDADIEKQVQKKQSISLRAQIMRTSTPESVQCSSPLCSMSEIENSDDENRVHLRKEQNRTAQEQKLLSHVASTSSNKTSLDQAQTPFKHATTPFKNEQIRLSPIPSTSNYKSPLQLIPTPFKYVNTPFKNALYFPKKTEPARKNKNNKVTPTVATAEDFINHMKKIEKEKEDKENLKQKRKREAIEKQKEKEAKKQKPFKVIKLKKPNSNPVKKTIKPMETNIPSTSKIGAQHDSGSDNEDIFTLPTKRVLSVRCALFNSDSGSDE